MAKLQREGARKKVAELQYGKLPQLEAQLKAPRRGRQARPSRPSGCRAPKVGAEESPRW